MGNSSANTANKKSRFIFGVSLATWVVTSSKTSSAPVFRRIQQIVKGGTKMFRIKICGVTCVEDAKAAVEAGADALGLNFFPTSCRYITIAQAEEICACLPPSITRVGVFVDASLHQMRELAERLRLDWLQLHGDEPPQYIPQLSPYRVMRAFRQRGSDFRHEVAYLDACRHQGVLPAAVLIDAYQSGEYGGTGKTANWNSVPDFQKLR
jgi:phosphoribosylanthranilate isomerase